jgi:glycosyltransferase involved in cell wall biosynthesis
VNPSGENRVVDSETAALEGRGVEVTRMIADSDDIASFGVAQRVALPIRPLWSPASHRTYRALVAEARPDVLHLHNPYPLISPAIVRWAHADGIPVVQTVHNVRHACLSATFARDGRECRLCEHKAVPWPGVLHGCYRGSVPQSAAQALAHTVHRSTFRLVERYLPVSRPLADTLVASGIAPDRITVRPNGLADPGPVSQPGRGVLFAGRLTADKGVDLLLALWSSDAAVAQLPLVVAGDGELRPQVEDLARSVPTVTYVGTLSAAEMAAAMRSAAVVVVPSQVPEGLPMVAVEAMAHGRAVVASALGGLPDMVDASVGALVAPEPAALAMGLEAAAGDAEARGAASRARYLERYTEALALDRLLVVYDELVASGP